MATIVIAEAIATVGVDALKAAGHTVHELSGQPRDALAAALSEADALIVRSQVKVDAALIAAGPKLRIRRLVLGPFRSALNPIGVMDAGFVAREILRQVGWNCSLVIVTPNPLTYVLMPLATVSRWLYFSLVSRPSP